MMAAAMTGPTPIVLVCGSSTGASFLAKAFQRPGQPAARNGPFREFALSYVRKLTCREARLPGNRHSY
jgi:hypothetical protein